MFFFHVLTGLCRFTGCTVAAKITNKYVDVLFSVKLLKQLGIPREKQNEFSK